MPQTTQPTRGVRIVQHMMQSLGLSLEEIENRIVYDLATANVPPGYEEHSLYVLSTVRTMRSLPGEEIH